MKVRSATPGALLTFLVILNGCAAMRPGRLPSNLTAARALEALGQNQDRIHDFTATARVTTMSGGETSHATVQVREAAPGLFRLYIKGFAGIDVARVSALADSVTVYVPPENYWFRTSRTSPELSRMIPELGIGFDTIAMVFASALPVEEDLRRYETSLEWEGSTAVLVLRGDGMARRMYLDGSGLRVRRDELYRGDELVWRKTVDSFRTIRGIEFPEKLTILYGTDEIALAFSSITINTGLTEDSLRFPIPNSVERIDIESEH